jgi:pimeloyl-ACP methyl ester carboxylesterase
LIEPRFADLPGVRLLYRDSGGDGPVVLFLHANTGTSESWAPQFGPLIEAGYRVVAFDRRGRGGSVPVPETGSQPGSVGEDLAALAGHLGLSRFVPVGVAGGGFQALDYAAWKPEQVRGLVIVASNGSISEPEMQAAYKRLHQPFIDDTNRHFLEVSPSYRLTDPEGLARWIELEDESRSQHQPLQPLRTPNTFAKLATIQVRTLVVSGCADMLAPPPLMQMWAAHVPQVDFHEFPRAGHALPWEQPETFNTLLLDYLGSLGA